MQTSGDGGSSPLVPILIGIAALAAISIAAVMVRQRSHRHSPEAEGSAVRAEIAERSVAPCKPVLAPPNSAATASGAAGQGSHSGG